MVVWDILRLVAFLEAAAIVGITIKVLQLYHYRYREATLGGTAGRRKGPRRHSRKRDPGRRKRGLGGTFDVPWIGLIPLYVWLMSVGALLMTVSLTMLVTHNVSDPPVWYGLPLALAAFTPMVIGLLALALYEHRLIHPPR